MAHEEVGFLTNSVRPPVDAKGCLKWRYIVAILGSMGMAIIYGLKVNLSVAIVAMVNHTALEELNEDNSTNTTSGHHGDSKAEAEDGPFIWSSKVQGMILSSYFIGYFITQLPGGRMAELYSAKYVFFVATLMNTAGALLTPVTAYLDFRALMAMRVIQGLGGGFTFPAMNVLIASWSPPNERSTISSIAYSGTSLGTVISYLSSGVISANLGWDWVFYIQGGLSVIWCVLWLICVTDTPPAHKFADKAEINFIEDSKPAKAPTGPDGGAPKALPIPWCSIFSSVPFLTLAFAHFCNNFGWYMLLIELPLFVRSGLGVGMAVNTIISCVPFFVNWGFSVGFSKCLDWARGKQYISTTVARKISVCVASLVPGTCLLGICWSGVNIPVIVTLMILAVMFYGSMFSGVFSNHSDLAPNFAGTLMAFTNMLATVPGFLVPLLVGKLTDGAAGLAPWHTVFYITAVILLLEAITYVLFGTGELQSWNSGSSAKNKNDV